ncbi:MAG TPA: hypothetical protein VET23_09500 [Chitinophagaceae bacterium]|nr:hypothetical protein [Chitinophagaceae bacterium]
MAGNLLFIDASFKLERVKLKNINPKNVSLSSAKMLLSRNPIFLLFFFLIQIECFSQQSNNLSSIVNKFDSISVFNSLVWLKDFEPIAPTFKIEDKIDPTLNIIMYDSLTHSEINNVIKIADKYIKRLSISQQNKIFRKITYWCSAEEILTSIANFDGDFSFPEIIFYLPETKNIINKYISDTTLQSWESLSSYQINSLFHDVLNFIANLNELSQINFYNNYIKLAVKLNHKKN